MVFFYDLRSDGIFVNVETKMDAFARCGDQLGYDFIVPVLSRGATLNDWLAGKTVKEAANGKSTLYDGPREGVVITPQQESRHPVIGRMILKQRSPAYLAGSDY